MQLPSLFASPAAPPPPPPKRAPLPSWAPPSDTTARTVGELAELLLRAPEGALFAAPTALQRLTWKKSGNTRTYVEIGARIELSRASWGVGSTGLVYLGGGGGCVRPTASVHELACSLQAQINRGAMRPDVPVWPLVAVLLLEQPTPAKRGIVGAVAKALRGEQPPPPPTVLVLELPSPPAPPED